MAQSFEIPLAPAIDATYVGSPDHDMFNLRDLYNYQWYIAPHPRSILAVAKYNLPMTYNPHSIDGLIAPFELADVIDFILTEFSLKLYYEGMVPFPDPDYIDTDETYTSLYYNLIEVRCQDFRKPPLTENEHKRLKENLPFITDAFREIMHNFLPFIWNFHNMLPPPLKNPWPRERTMKLLSIQGGSLCIGLLPTLP